MLRAASTALAALAALALPAAAHAITPGVATVGADSRATFSWTAGAGETSPSVSVAKSPAVDTNGGLASSFEYEWFDNPATTSWTTDDQLHAGAYWYQLGAYDANYDKVQSAPTPFTVPVAFAAARPTFTCVRRKKLSLRTGWTTNVPDLAYRATILHGRRQLTNLKYTEYLPTSQISVQQREDHDWTPLFGSAFPKGATYRATVRVTGPGVNFVRTLTARCR